MRKAHGDAGFAQRVNTAFDLAQQLVTKIQTHPRLMMVQLPECTNVCFWYLPDEFDTMTATRHTIQDQYDRIHTLNARIKERLLRE